MAEDTPQDLPEEQPEPARFNVRQQKFIDGIVAGKNCTQAAIAADYSAETAYSIGSRLLKNVEIRGEIDRKLADLALPALAVTKLISDIAQSSVNEFLTVYDVEVKTTIPQPLAEAIAEYESTIAFEEEFSKRAKLSGKDLKTHQALQASRQRQVIRWQLQLEKDAGATRTVEGPLKLEKRTRLDLERLAEAKENGRIKSFSYTEFGPKVEFYPADAALDKLARMHGLYEKDNRQQSGMEVIVIGGGSDEAAA